ncbi:MAG: hypothetical protein GYA47_10730 [Desulfovibrio sp.]|nr:hypothetical protein [Desulfovibrio sp.]
MNVQQITRDQSPGSIYYENRPVETENGEYTQEYTAVETSNVDMAVQMVHMIRDQHAYSANIVAIRTQDELVGSVLDMTA